MNRVSAAFLEAEFTGEKLAANWVFDKLKDKNNLIIFDCGANVGSYAKMILEISGGFKNRVSMYLFEPSRKCFETLKGELGNKSNLYLNQLGVADKNTTAKLFYPWQGAAGASLSDKVSEIQGTGSFPMQSEEVKLVSIDSFCEEHQINAIDFLKLDVEGYELSALNGASKMLDEGRISFIQVEIGTSSLATKCLLYDIWNLLNTTYDFFLILNQGIVQIQYSPDLECFLGASNFLLACKEQ